MMGEYEESIFEQATEGLESSIDTPEGVYEPIEQPCVDQLGFVAVCAACPLLRMFGECPKEIREQAPRIDELGIEDELAASSIVPAEPYSLAEALDENSSHDEIMSESGDVTVANIERPAKPEGPTRVRLNIERRRERQKDNREYTDIITPPPKRRQAAKQEAFGTLNFRALLFDDSVPIVTSFSSQPEMPRIAKSTPYVIKEDMSHKLPVHEVPPVHIEHGPQPLVSQKEQVVEVNSPIPDIIVTHTPVALQSFQTITVAVDAQPKNPDSPVQKEILHTSTAAPLVEVRKEVPRDVPVAIPAKRLDAATPVPASVQYAEPLSRTNDVSIEPMPHVDDRKQLINAPFDIIANINIEPHKDESEQTQVAELIEAESLYLEATAAIETIYSHRDACSLDEPEEYSDTTPVTPERLTRHIFKDARTHTHAAHFTLGFLALLLLVKQPTAQ